VTCSLVEVDRRFRGANCHWNFGLLKGWTRHNPEVCRLHSCRRENVKSQNQIAQMKFKEEKRKGGHTHTHTH